MDLFEAANSATVSTPVVAATKNYDTLNYQEALNLGWLPYDTLEIQARVVSLLRSDRPTLSWHLLEEMKLPESRADCTSSLTLDFRPYYEVMASSLHAMDSNVTPTGETKVAYLTGRIQELQSPAQIAGFLENFDQLGLSVDQEQVLSGNLIRALANVNGSDREMYGVEQTGALTQAVAAVVTKEKSDHIDPIPLLAAYRAFLIRNLHSKACADISLDRNTVAKAYNQLDPARIGVDANQLQPLTIQDLSPTGRGDIAKDEAMPAAEDVRPQQRRITMIFVANQQAHHSDDSLDSYQQPAAADVNDMLRHATSEETREGMSDLGRYEDTQSTLMLLIELLPPGPSFKDAIDAEAAFLNLNPIEQSSPLSWLRCFKELIAISRPANEAERGRIRKEIQSGHAVIMAPSPNAKFIRDTLRRYQSDPVISIYLAYEDLFHPGYVSFKNSHIHQPL